MVKLTKRTMNNVVIFSMLFMMLLFNLDSFLPTSKAPEEQWLLPQDVYLLKIEQGDQRLERAGQQWRQVSERALADITPEQQLTAWQQARLQPVQTTNAHETSQSPYVAVVWLAGEPQGMVVAFYPGKHATWVKLNGQWFSLQGPDLHTLLPWNPELVATTG